MSTAQSDQVNEEDVARRAYELWEARGCPPGDGTEDWDAAMAELTDHRRFENGHSGGGLRHWWNQLRQKITGRDM